MSKSKDNKKSSKMTNSQIAMCGVLIALGMVLSYLENLVPINVAIPGVKLGIANIVTIIALQRLGIKQALSISVGRVILSGLLFGNMLVIMYSLSGALLSILVMWLVGHIKLFTVTGVSVCGAVAHNFGQLVVAAIMLENESIFYYMLALTITGTIAGAVIGITAAYVLKNIRF